MQTLREKMRETSEFLWAVEIVSSRGTMSQKKVAKAVGMSKELAKWGKLSWMSITDNPGGNPMLPAVEIARPLREAGAEVVVHLSCKDNNRNGLESQAWQLANEGLYNVLALSGDYPASSFEGGARAVGDIDSIALIKLLVEMREGLTVGQPTKKRPEGLRLSKEPFFVGAVVTNYKLHEGEVVPQLFKLTKKLEVGADFIISQIGYDARKASELAGYYAGLERAKSASMIGNAYLLNDRVAKVFHAGKIPGVVVSDRLLAECEKQGKAEDKGRAWFIELAAKQVAIYRGLGYRGAYLGGIERAEEPQRIMEIEASFSPDDWKQFATQVSYSRPGEFFCFSEKPGTGLADPERPNAVREQSPGRLDDPKKVDFNYRLSRAMHGWLFTPEKKLWNPMKKLYERSEESSQGPGLLRKLEKTRKDAMFECKDCGDCSLPEIAYLCPESQCSKNQRNGPCGGTRDGLCEARDSDCIWKRAYERLKYYGEERGLLDHAPVIQDNSLRFTSSWANLYLERDHAGRARRQRTEKDKSVNAKVEYMPFENLTIIGETINDSVPSTKRLFDANDMEGLKELATSQDEKGASYIDVNVGQRSPAFMADLVRRIQSVTAKPLSIDTPDFEIAKAALRAYDLKRTGGAIPVLNSVSAMRTEMFDLYWICRFRPILLVSEGRNDAGESVLCKTADETHRAAKNLIRIAREKCGIKNGDCIIDPGIAPMASDTEGNLKRLLGAIELIRRDSDFDGVHISVGLSNFTVMLPSNRANGESVKVPLQNAFLTKAIPLGLDTIIGAAGRKYRELPNGDDAMACLEEFLKLDGFDAIMRLQQFYS